MREQQTVSETVAVEIGRLTGSVFGVMGNGNAYFIDALTKHGIDYVPMRHEAGAVAAADAYHRVTDCIGVATVTYGAGFTNTLTALQEAVMAATPMLLVTGDAPSTGRRDFDTQQDALAEAVGAVTISIDSEHGVEKAIERAVGVATKRLVPVILALPADVAIRVSQSSDVGGGGNASASAVAPRSEASGPSDMSDEVIEAVARALSTAHRPLLIAGRGARLASAGQSLSALARKLGGLTCTSLLATGIFEEEEFDLGVAGGFAHPTVRALIGAADAVLVAGARLNQFQMHFGQLLAPEATTIQIDRRQEARHSRADIFVEADIGPVVETLLDHVRLRDPEETWRATAQLPGEKRHLLWDGNDEWEVKDSQGRQSDDRLDPRALVRELETTLPRNRVLVEDLGSFAEWMPTRTTLPGPGRVAMLGSAYQSVGLGLPGSVGASRGVPDATVVLATGDGGFLMALADFESLIREAPSAVVVIFNDAAYGAELHQYAAFGASPEPMLLPDIPFAQLAESMGATGVTVATLDDLEGLSAWVSRGSHGTLVLDCKVSRQVVGPVLSEVALRLPRPNI